MDPNIYEHEHYSNWSNRFYWIPYFYLFIILSSFYQVFVVKFNIDKILIFNINISEIAYMLNILQDI